MSFPIYGPDPNIHVSLSIPGIPSEICKSVGLTANANFLIPTIPYIMQCAVKGDLGISNQILLGSALTNLNKSSNSKTLSTLANSLGVTINVDPEKYKRTNGKGYNLPESSISMNVNNPKTNTGLHMIEKVSVKSMFETYKPWIEVAKILIQSLVSVEDVIARSLAVGVQSEKPITNSGNSSRPPALGYKGGSNIAESIGTLSNIVSQTQKQMNDLLGKIGPSASVNSMNPSQNSNPNTNGSNQKWEILSTEYSTGTYQPNVAYQYSYIDLTDYDTIQLGNPTFSFNINNDPYNGLRPKTMIFGIYDSNGNPISPTDDIKSYTIDSKGNITYGPDIYFQLSSKSPIQGIPKADWLLRTGRWYNDFTMLNIVYQWEKNGVIKYSSKNPSTLLDKNWKQLFIDGKTGNVTTETTYKVNDGNGNTQIISNQPALGPSDTTDYTSMFNDIITKKYQSASASKWFNGEIVEIGMTLDEVRNQVLPKINISQYVDNLISNGFFADIKSNGILSDNGTPTSLPKNFMNSISPQKLKINGNDVWIDAESDYELKIIQVDPISKIQYQDTSVKGSPIVTADIIRFIKNTINLKLSNGGNFNVDIIQRSSLNSNWVNTLSNENISELSYDNWNYTSSNLKDTLDNNMRIKIRITSDKTPFTDSSIKWTNIKNNTSYQLNKYGNDWVVVTLNNNNIIFDDDYDFIKSGLDIGGRLQINKNLSAYFDRTNYKLIKWEYLLFDSNIISNKSFLPKNIGDLKSWTLDTSKLLSSNNSLSSVDGTAPINQLRVSANGNSNILIDPSKITNSQLAEDNPLVDRYASGIGKEFYGHSSNGNPQQIKRVFRYMKSEYDTETYFLIEGILPTYNDEIQDGSNGSSNSGSNGGDSKYYKTPAFLGVMKDFSSLLTDIFTQLIPSINKLISLINNPSNFIVDIIREKLAESSVIFSTQFVNDLKTLDSFKSINDKRSFAKSSSLKDYVYVDPKSGSYKILFDGEAIKKLSLFGLNISFGIKVSKAIPTLVFSSSMGPATSNSLQNILNGTSYTNNQNLLNTIGNINNNPSTTTKSNGVNPNPPIDSTLNGESVTIVYSTVTYDPNVKYQYIYVTEYVSNLISQGDILASTNDSDSMIQALNLYEQALQQDPNNQAIKDRISNLMKKIPDSTQPIMELLLSLVTAPLTLILEVAQYILNFFKGLSNPFTLASDIAKFLSFTWIAGAPDAIFGIPNLLMAFGIEKFPISGSTNPNWDDSFKKFTSLKAGIMPDGKSTVNYTDIISMSFEPFMKTPTNTKGTTLPCGCSSMTQNQISTWFKNNKNISYDKFNLSAGLPPIIEIEGQFICFICAVVNSIIDLFWSILGLEALIPVREVHLNLCNQFNSLYNMSAQNIANLLQGKFADPNSGTTASNSLFGDGTNGNSQFLYEIKTSDGRDITSLNAEELQQWVKDNQNIQFNFEF